MTSNRLFVLHLQKLQNLLSQLKEAGKAQIMGSVYRSKCGYPVLGLEGPQSIQGTVYNLDFTEIQMSLLDELMGYNPQNLTQSLYHRTPVTVLIGGVAESVWAYVINPLKISMDMKLIEDADWQTSLSAHPPLTEKLTDKQKSYIKKLGSSSGRDVIPINLALYRELMNLELIVDKGRRLALSKFGQEVFSYL